MLKQVCWFVVCEQVLKQVCEVLTGKGRSGETAATAMLCAAEIISCVQGHAIVHLPRIMPAILQQLQDADALEWVAFFVENLTFVAQNILVGDWELEF